MIVLEGFFTLMLVWLVVYLATRKGHSRRAMSQYEKDRIRRSNKSFVEQEKLRSRKMKQGLRDLFWGSSKSL